MTKVITFGVYDLIHRGHVELFKRAKTFGEHLTVFVHDSEKVEKWGGAIISTEDRIYMCKAIKYVDAALPYKDMDIELPFIDFDILVCGEDQLCYPHFIFAQQYCKENGKKMIALPRTVGISSKEIKERIYNIGK